MKLRSCLLVSVLSVIFLSVLLFVFIIIFQKRSDWGEIRNALPDTSFVNSPDLAYIESGDDNFWYIAGFDGKKHRKIFEGSYYIENISADGDTFILSNIDTDLFIAKNGGRNIVEVDWFHGRLGKVALTPDGKRAILTRHADFDLPQDQQVEDPSLYLLDTENLKFRKVAEYEDRYPYLLAWIDDETVMLDTTNYPNQVINIKTGEVRLTEEDPRASSERWQQRFSRGAMKRAEQCGYEINITNQGDEGFSIVGDKIGTKQLVVVEGRERGHHDYMDTIYIGYLTSDCKYIVYYYYTGYWVVEIETGKTGPYAAENIHIPWYPIKLETN